VAPDHSQLPDECLHSADHLNGRPPPADELPRLLRGREFARDVRPRGTRRVRQNGRLSVRRPGAVSVERVGSADGECGRCIGENDRCIVTGRNRL
jgi:hypothetical protein